MDSSSSLWRAPYAAAPIDGAAAIPGSKSLMARALILAAAADGPSVIHRALRARDTLLMAQAIQSLGASVNTDGDSWQVSPGFADGDVTVDAGLSGTVMRFAPPLAGLVNGKVRFDGDAGARTRPMGALLDGLRQAGVDVQGDTLPFNIIGHGRVAGGSVEIDASASSQFVSGLMLSAARFEHGLTIRHTGGSLPSQPHIEMTVECLREQGVDVDTSVAAQWRVSPGPIRAIDRTIEPDLSNAAPFLAAALATGGTVRIPGWPTRTSQPGAALPALLAQMGASYRLEDDVLVVSGGSTILGIDADLSEVGELTPVIAALCALATTPSVLRGVAHIRGHETDRLAALATEFNRLGGDVQDTEDGLIIKPRALHSGVFDTYDDHRIAHAAAVIGLCVDGVQVSNIETTAKTMPGFARLWTDLVVGADAPAPEVAEMSR